ncbi:helix-turn-helix transcriptional regulator [Crossiella sp. NPDC003009]
MTAQVQRLWTAEDVAAYLGVPVTTLYAWRTKNYGPPARRIGKYLRYRPCDVQTWVDQLNSEVA